MEGLDLQCPLSTERHFTCRYDDILFGGELWGLDQSNEEARRIDKNLLGSEIMDLNVYVSSNDQSLNMQTDESYALEVDAPSSSLSVSLISHSHFLIVGFLRQLIA